MVSATLHALADAGAAVRFGMSIEEATDLVLKQSRADDEAGHLTTWSFDMLGEGARTWADADRYLQAYQDALKQIGQASWSTLWRPKLARPPRFVHQTVGAAPTLRSPRRHQVLQELMPRLLHPGHRSGSDNILLTIDAEESHRLELQLAVLSSLVTSLEHDGTLLDWPGLGLAIQAYQLRASAMIQSVVHGAAPSPAGSPFCLVKAPAGMPRIKRA